MKRLEGKVAVVTGAGKGLGEGIAVAFAEEGADIVVAARTREDLDKVVEKIEEKGQQGLAVQCDITDAEAVDRLFDEALKKFGKVDILVNNAGINIPTALADTPIEDFDRVIDTNLRAVFLCSRLAIRDMRKRNQGLIINVSSILGSMVRANRTAYCASKWGVRGLSGALLSELKDTNIRVSVLSPGATSTPMNWELHPDHDMNDYLDVSVIGNAAVYLATQDQGTVIPEIIVEPTFDIL